MEYDPDKVEFKINGEVISDTIRTFTVNFEGVCPVGNCLVINAYSKYQAFEIAKLTIAHTEITYDDVIEFQGIGVVEYLSGDY